jgi:hypothetical protein
MENCQDGTESMDCVAGIAVHNVRLLGVLERGGKTKHREYPLVRSLAMRSDWPAVREVSWWLKSHYFPQPLEAHETLAHLSDEELDSRARHDKSTRGGVYRNG